MVYEKLNLLMKRVDPCPIVAVCQKKRLGALDDSEPYKILTH